MTDFELESKLKGVPLPGRPAEYWDNFPAQVRDHLRRPPVEYAARSCRVPVLAWRIGFALAGVMMALAARPAFQSALQDERTLRREVAQLPGHLRAMMQDEHGLHYLVADQP